MKSRISVIPLVFFSTVAWTNAFNIQPIPPATLSVPVTVSWFRKEGDGSSPNWFFKKQNMNGAVEDDDVVHRTSEPISVPNLEGKSGEVVMTFTFSPGTFRLLAFNEDEAGSKGPFFISKPTITVIKEGIVPTTTETSIPMTINAPPEETKSNDTPTAAVLTSKSDSSGTSLSGIASQPEITGTSSAISNSSSSLVSITASGSSTGSGTGPFSNSNDAARHSNAPVVIGIAVGGSLGLLLILAIIYYTRRRRRQRITATSVLFHREMMVRSNLDHYPDKYQLGTLVEAEIGTKENTSTSLSRSSSLEFHDTPALSKSCPSRNYCSSAGEAREGPPDIESYCNQRL